MNYKNGPVTPQLVPRHNRSPRPSAANYVAVDGPPGPSMAAMDGPLCRSGPPLANRLKVDKTVAGIPTERTDCLIKRHARLLQLLMVNE